jgi:small neutral amino acid transporter SnatA (MarC family)
MGEMLILNVQPLEKVMEAVARETVVVHETFDGLLVVVVERQHGEMMVEVFEMRMKTWQMDENEIMTFGTALNIVAIEMAFAEEGRHGSRRCSLTYTRGGARDGRDKRRKSKMTL